MNYQITTEQLLARIGLMTLEKEINLNQIAGLNKQIQDLQTKIAKSSAKESSAGELDAKETRGRKPKIAVSESMPASASAS